MKDAPAKAKATREAKAGALWDGLNERQRAYLEAVYREDREEEAYQRSAWSRGGRAQAASAWRWILYGSPLVGATSLRTSLQGKGLVDEGTGSTFAALADRGLLQTRKASEPVAVAGRIGYVEVLYVKMTTKGRVVVRVGTFEPPLEGCLPGEAKLPAGTLKEWHWRALAKAYDAGEDGVDYYAPGVGWRTWERLLGYAALGYGPLVQRRDDRRYGISEVVVIGPGGERFVEERREEYARRYPSVVVGEASPAEARTRGEGR